MLFFSLKNLFKFNFFKEDWKKYSYLFENLLLMASTIGLAVLFYKIK